MLERWLAQQAQSDPRVGGHYRLETDEPGIVPEPHVCSGEYREFVPDQRLVMTWIYNGPHPEDLAESLVTVDFVPINTDATEIRFREVGEGLGDRRGAQVLPSGLGRRLQRPGPRWLKTESIGSPPSTED